MDKDLDMDQGAPSTGTPVGEILGITHAINVACSTESFRDWLHDFHGVRNTTNLFGGYKFAVRTLFRVLHGTIATNRGLDLTEDFVFSRARFCGAPIWHVPNTCEKAIILKNIHELSGILFAAKSWARFDRLYLETELNILRPLNQLRSAANLSSGNGVSDLDTAISYASQFLVYLFLNDTRSGLPMGYIQPLLIDSVFRFAGKRNRDYLDRVFDGYKLTVQYLWYSLLGANFRQTKLTDMHQAENWDDFDEFFSTIKSEVIEPLESHTGMRSGFDGLVTQSEAKSLLTPLLCPRSPEKQLSAKEGLERNFYWYEIEMVDSSSVFNGVLSFVSLLAGTIELKKRFGSTEKTLVVRVKHPRARGTGNDYSYGLLLEAFSNTGLSDYSGWLLFYDCCGDYSGFSGSEHSRAEQFIDESRKDGSVELAEINIEKKRFLELMEESLL